MRKTPHSILSINMQQNRTPELISISRRYHRLFFALHALRAEWNHKIYYPIISLITQRNLIGFRTQIHSFVIKALSCKVAVAFAFGLPELICRNMQYSTLAVVHVALHRSTAAQLIIEIANIPLFTFQWNLLPPHFAFQW